MVQLEIKLSVVVLILAATTIAPTGIAALPLPADGEDPIDRKDRGSYHDTHAYDSSAWCVDVQCSSL
jgi:hypothetical protein